MAGSVQVGAARLGQAAERGAFILAVNWRVTSQAIETRTKRRGFDAFSSDLFPSRIKQNQAPETQGGECLRNGLPTSGNVRSCRLEPEKVLQK